MSTGRGRVTCMFLRSLASQATHTIQTFIITPKVSCKLTDIFTYQPNHNTESNKNIKSHDICSKSCNSYQKSRDYHVTSPVLDQPIVFLLLVHPVPHHQHSVVQPGLGTEVTVVHPIMVELWGWRSRDCHMTSLYSDGIITHLNAKGIM